MTKRVDLNAPENWLKWLKAVSTDPGCPYEAKVNLGAITGTDRRVLGAIASLWHLCDYYDSETHRAALAAIAILLPHMQPSCWPFARELAAQALDWNDRYRLWPLVEPISKLCPRTDPAIVRDQLDRFVEHQVPGAVRCATWTCNLCMKLVDNLGDLDDRGHCEGCAYATSLGTEDKAS